MKKTSLFGKIRSIFDRKQKKQLMVLGVMIFIGGLLETLGVGGMIPVVTALLTPEELMGYVNEYEILQVICDRFHIQDTAQITLALLVGLMVVYVIKNLYVLFLTYK